MARHGDILNLRGVHIGYGFTVVPGGAMQEITDRRNYRQEEKERIERREFQLLMALIHKLKSAAAVLDRI